MESEASRLQKVAFRGARRVDQDAVEAREAPTARRVSSAPHLTRSQTESDGIGRDQKDSDGIRRTRTNRTEPEGLRRDQKESQMPYTEPSTPVMAITPSPPPLPPPQRRSVACSSAARQSSRGGMNSSSTQRSLARRGAERSFAMRSESLGEAGAASTCVATAPSTPSEAGLNSWPARQSVLPPGAAQRSRTRWPARGASARVGNGDAPSRA